MRSGQLTMKASLFLVALLLISFSTTQQSYCAEYKLRAPQTEWVHISSLKRIIRLQLLPRDKWSNTDIPAQHSFRPILPVGVT
jgi:hypothetical protein